MPQTTPITAVFDRLREQDRMAFMPFVSAGDPDLDGTRELIGLLGEAGVDLIEVGFPYSDPIADGPVIQASYTRALAKGTTVDGILKTLKETHTEDGPPVLAMVSYAIVFRHGLQRFVDEAAEAGVAGLIVPDLPGDEAAEFLAVIQAAGMDLVQLIAPTTPRDRARRILAACSGFVYCVAISGTTGVRESVAENLLEQLRWLREETDLPLAVGFGIKGPEHVERLRGLADGVIVGSGIVRHLEPIAEDLQSRETAFRAISEFARAMSNAAHGG